jgi:histidyl-tRNA synthetase
VLLLASGHQAKEAFSLAQSLRAAGINVIEERIKRTHKASLTWATQEARRRGLSQVILCEPQKGVSASVLLLKFFESSLKPKQTRVALQDLPQHLQAEKHDNF